MAEPIRSDARRNREKLLQVATAAFATAAGRPVSLEAIARDAGVGIGTLYRHFANREALVEAVFRAELAEVAEAAEQLLKRYPPKVALRRWMDRYANFVAAKRGMAESLHAIFDSGAMRAQPDSRQHRRCGRHALEGRRRRRQPALRRARR